MPGIENFAPLRTDTSSGCRRIAELLAGRLFDGRERRLHLVHQAVGELHAGGRVGVAGFGGDREAGRHGQPQVRHLGEVRALAAEQLLLVLVTLVEQVDVLRRHVVSVCVRRGAAGVMLVMRLGCGEAVRWLRPPRSVRRFFTKTRRMKSAPKLRMASLKRHDLPLREIGEAQQYTATRSLARVSDLSTPLRSSLLRGARSIRAGGWTMEVGS